MRYSLTLQVPQGFPPRCVPHPPTTASVSVESPLGLPKYMCRARSIQLPKIWIPSKVCRDLMTET